MNQDRSLLPAVLFTLKLKLFSNLIDVDVLSNDDKISIANRVCREHNIDQKYCDVIQQKILNSMKNVLQQDEIRQSLFLKISNFFEKNRPIGNQLQNQMQTQKYIQNKNEQIQSNTPIKKHSRNVSEIYKLKEKNINSLNRTVQINPQSNKKIKNSNQISNISHYQSKSTQNGTKCLQTINEKNKQINYKGSLRKSANKDKQPHYSIKSRQKDLLKAYQNVHSKCRDLQMKQRAKKFLDEFENNNEPLLKQKDINANSFTNIKQFKVNQKIQKKSNQVTQLNNHKQRFSNKIISTQRKNQQFKDKDYTLISKKDPMLMSYRSRLELKTRYIPQLQFTNEYIDNIRSRNKIECLRDNSHSSHSLRRKYNYLEQF